MKRVTCTNCGGGHAIWDCKRPAKKSTERKNKPVANGDAPDASLGLEDRASSANQAVDTNSGSEAQVEERRSPKPEVASSILATLANAGSSNGRTAPFDGVNTGSSPVPASIPKRPRGRPKSITDMKTYKAEKQREYRKRWSEKQREYRAKVAGPAGLVNK